MASLGPFSYYLKISIEPQWAEIIKRVTGLKTEQEQLEFGKKIKVSGVSACETDLAA